MSELFTELSAGLTDDFDSNVEFQDYGADNSGLDIPDLERAARGNIMADFPSCEAQFVRTIIKTRTAPYANLKRS